MDVLQYCTDKSKVIDLLLEKGFWSGLLYLWRELQEWKKYIELSIHIQKLDTLLDYLKNFDSEIKWKYSLLFCYRILGENTEWITAILLTGITKIGSNSVLNFFVTKN
eukprot:UN13254